MPGSRSALIVANDQYHDPGLRRLRAPGQDAEALARVLGDRAIGGFEVKTVANQPEHRLRRAIASFFADRRRDDLLLAHFSCHGVKDDNGQLYFATADTELDSLDTTAVSADFVNRHMSRSRSRRIVLLLDCCYSGAFARGLLARADTSVDLRDRFEGRGRIVLTASSAMEYAFEDAELSAGRGRPSVFTHALVQGLESGKADRNGDGFVSVDELYDYVSDQVRRTTPRQTPGRWDFELQGEMLIARTPSPRAVPLPAELLQALDHPFAAVRLAAIEELKRLLRGGHAGYALAAAAALRDLAGDDSQRVSSAAAAALSSSAPPPAVPAPPPVRRPAPAAPASPPVRRAPTAAPAGTSATLAAPPPTAARTARPTTARAGARSRHLPVLAVLTVLVALLTVVGGMRLLDRAGQQLTVGQPFRATSPWRLQVEGSNCAVRVAPSGGVATDGYGSNYSLQIRTSGAFTVLSLTSGCTASVAAGAGTPVSLPFTIERAGDGAGGDSPPFTSPGGFRLLTDGSGCRTRVDRTADGSPIAELYGTARWEHNQSGSFYVHSDPRCRTRVEPL